ncbi:hypothetical protein Zmor_019498 [Zophobas morio]|uniref:PNT domain-containing protein n=1 Tax=Zophobas morio TaxID=2755281 RepID=A0AA38M9E4_9CUCU|nr:hypothetical protein Zmor_019498 [Zophobas morio]
MAEALKASFASWEKEQVRLNITKDPRQWTENHVAHWLQWAAKEFSLECIPLHQFRMKGKDICAMGKDAFAARAPAFVGDILWEHLELLQKDVERERSLTSTVVPGSLYNSMCVPDLNFLDYQGSMIPEDRKPVTITPGSNSAPTPPNNNNFLHDVSRTRKRQTHVPDSSHYPGLTNTLRPSLKLPNYPPITVQIPANCPREGAAPPLLIGVICFNYPSLS